MTVVEPERVDPDRVVSRVFSRAIEILGGPKRLIEYRRLTWLPSLMEACYAVVLRELYHRTVGEIAGELGVTEQTVRNILSADEEAVLRRVRGGGGVREGERELRTHVAGGLAKLAWRDVRKGVDEHSAFIDHSREALEAVEGPTWAIRTLIAIRGLDFPVEDPEVLAERLRGIRAYGADLGDLARGLEYPVDSPASLLRALASALSARRES